MAAEAASAPEAAVRAFLENSGTVKAGDTVVVAVSGGADSMCLLHVFKKYSSQFGFNILAAHFEHGLRAEASLRDAAFVESFCRREGIACRVEYGSVPDARMTGESVETCARRLRYQFLERIDDSAWIATAHNADDNAETMLLALARGTGLKGLGGIPPVRGRIIRPLLDVTRSQIEAYLKREAIPFVTDETNLEDAYSRNRIRHLAIPALTGVDPSAVTVMKRCADSLREDEACLDALAREALTGFDGLAADCAPLTAAHPAIAKRAIRLLVERWGCLHAEKRHIDALYDGLTAGCNVNLPGGLIVRVEAGRVYPVFHKLTETAYDDKTDRYALGAAVILMETADADSILPLSRKQLSLSGYADADALSGAVFRLPAPGDTFLHGGTGRRIRLGAYLARFGVPAGQRASVPVLCRDHHVLWSAYAGVSGEALAAAGTSRPVRIYVQKERF